MDARKKMRQVFNDRAAAKEKGEAGRKFLEDNFSWDEIGKLMRGRLQEIESSL